ncbi:MAG: 1-acyl-sn-glycerol-3-phosphate acyltransferase [Candidatus Omnitrophota bacterium]|jgi:1-acyl-sn-glycerol-3-phosphate acyltransferase|nr:MAG: 1-acyl-sn-glycerol-3-phosphate acyltransferase [Candidatus Omnitrophota bacterium]
MKLLYRIQWQLYRLFARSYFRLSVRGWERIPSTGAVLIAANHSSFLDPPLVGLGVHRQIATLAKEELFAIPILGRWIHSLGVRPIARGQGDIKAVRLAMRLLHEGNALLIFPEGTRSPDGVIQPFENGLAWLSIKTQTPVVPIYIDGAFRAMPKHAWFPWPVKIRMMIGEPIQPESTQTDSGAVEQFSDQIQKEMLALKQILEEECAGK